MINDLKVIQKENDCVSSIVKRYPNMIIQEKRKTSN